MPMTPYHFGPGLLLKAAWPGAVSLSAFVVANAAIDLEVLVRYLADRPPLHATLHTAWAATLVGVASGAVVAGAGRLMRRGGSELAAGPAMAGGLLGGISQPLLDSIVHQDVRPLAPLSDANPLFGSLSSATVEAGCVAAALVSGGILLLRSRRLSFRPLRRFRR